MNWLILFTGFCGGIIRGLVGFLKHQFSYKDVKFDIRYFLLMMFLSGLVGLVVAAVFNQEAGFSLIIGYAGGDFIENVYKTIKKSPSLYPEKD
ncbi:MAG: hypothetical protein PHW15_00370 [Patescibacteria group bacterium]|jgi:hypothetical protein|nr:hypothetical protein [Patescibacteria group bacterium]MDD5173176.1 hypothetical protein [Patescibacteria group bacterium]